jgi:hypothetical protein
VQGLIESFSHLETNKAMLIRIAAALRWRLARLGIEVIPYYWIEEGRHEVSLPPLADESGFVFEFLTPSDLKSIMSIKSQAFPRRRLEVLLQRIQEGDLCFRVQCNNEHIAWTWIKLDEAKFHGKSLRLASHEAYLMDIFTKDQFRGRNIAPHLRNRTYAALRNMGKTTFYSISDLLNIPSLRFKTKLRAEVRWLGLCIILCRKYHWHWKIKTYAQARPPSAD